MANQDVSLLFGVSTGGVAEEDSKIQIQKGLQAIIDDINKSDKLKVKIGVDTDADAQNNWQTQIQGALDAIGKSGQLHTQISQLTISDDALTNLTSRIQAALDSLRLNLTPQGSGGGTGGGAGGGSGGGSGGENPSDTGNLTRAEVTAQIEALQRLKSQISTSITNLKLSDLTDGEEASANSLIDRYTDLANRVDLLSKSYKDEEIELSDVAQQRDKLIEEFNDLNQQTQAMTQNTVANTTAVRENNAAMEQAIRNATQMRALTDNNSAILKGLSTIDRGDTTSFSESQKKALQDLRTEYDSFSVRLNDLKTSAAKGADISTERAELLKLSNTLRTITQSLAQIVSPTERAGDAAKKTADEIAAYNVQMRQLSELEKTVKGSSSALDTSVVGADSEQVKNLSERIQQLYVEIEKVRMSGNAASTETVTGIQASANAILDEINAINQEVAAQAQLKEQLDSIVQLEQQVNDLKTNAGGQTSEAVDQAEIAEVSAEYEKYAQSLNAAEEKLKAGETITAENVEQLSKQKAKVLELVAALEQKKAAQNQDNQGTEDATNNGKLYTQQLNKVNNLLIQLQRNLKNWTAAKYGKSSGDYAGLEQAASDLEILKSDLTNAGAALTDFDKRFGTISTQAKGASVNIQGMGENTKTLTDRMGGLATKFGSWLTVSQVIMQCVRAMRQMVSATIELDDAMTQLKIVTNATEKAYQEYRDTIAQTATEIGASITDLIDSATTYARLGYSLEDSSALAKYTAMLQNVGDIDVSDAQDAITAIFKAFDDIDIDNIESVMDKLVTTGNNFPISVSQIAEGMNNASSSLSAAGNTFEQSVALLTAANTTIQNASKSSTGLRAIAARIRNTTTELDDLGETMTEASYDELVSALTQYNVQLTDMNGEFRSTYDIISDIAAIWGDLSSMEQAGLANAIAGTRQQAIFYSLVEQFQEASGAMDEMSESAGALQSAYDTYMESTTAHINQFKAAFQELSQTTVSTDFLNGFIDFGTNLLGILNNVMKLVDALGGLNTVLKVTIGLLVISKADSIVGFFKDTATHIGTFVTGLKNITTAYKLMDTVQGPCLSSMYKLDVALESVGASATTAQLAFGALGVAVLAIVGLVKLYDALTVTAEEAYESAEKHRQSYEELSEEVDDLNEQLETNNARMKELYKLADEGTITFVEQDELDKLKEANEELAKTAGYKKYLADREAEDADSDYEASYNKKSYVLDNNAMFEASRKYLEQNQGLLTQYQENADALTDAQRGIIETVTANNEELNEAINTGVLIDKIVMPDGLGDAEEYVNYLLDLYQQLNELKESGLDFTNEDGTDNSFGDLLRNTKDELAGMQGYLDDLMDKHTVDNETEQGWKDLYDLITRNVFAVETFEARLDELPETCTTKLKELGQSGELTAEQVESLEGTFPVLQELMQSCGVSAADVATYFNALSRAQEEGGDTADDLASKLTGLKDVMDDYNSVCDVIAEAQTEMWSSGGVSADTIKSLAGLTDDYTKYLYEENGQIKVNIDLLKELAQSKVDHDVSELKDETKALEDQNKELEQNIEEYKEQRSLAADRRERAAYNQQIREATEAIEENNQKIKENQDLLRLYESIENPWTDTLSAFDSYTSSMENLASLQEELANGYTLTAAKAREFAEVYPELLQNAQATTDGLIQLDSDVAANFVEAERSRLNASIDVETARLESRRAVLQAEMDMLDIQLAYAQGTNEELTNADKKTADMRTLLLQGVLSAAEQAGMDETTANQLALAAMNGDWDTFQELATQACYDLDDNSALAFTDVMTNFADMAKNVTNNTIQMVRSFNNLAQAVANVKEGLQTGEYTATIDYDTVEGKGDKDISGLLSDMFTKAKSKYAEDNHQFDNSLDSYLEQLQEIYDSTSQATSDIADLQKQREQLSNEIGALDAQISVLNALKSTPISSFSKTSSSSSGSSSSSSTEDEVKEVEEYIATIEKYRAALKRLSDTQNAVTALERKLEASSDLNEQIDLQKQLIDAYEDEQYALFNLNSQRRETIKDGIKQLEELGFAVQYNADTNDLYIENLEHLNELQAKEQGEFETMEEATNDLREKTEDLIDSLNDLNEENQECSDQWWELKDSIKEAKDSIVEYLQEIVQNANDVVDGFQDVYTTLADAGKEWAENGYLSVDSYQAILDLGPKYLDFLVDENGQLQLNEQALQDVIAAKTEDMAASTALSYARQILQAAENGETQTLQELTQVSAESTGATWDLAYATLGLAKAVGVAKGMDASYFDNAVTYLNKMQTLSKTAVNSIQAYYKTLDESYVSQKDALETILQLTEDMIKQENQDKIDALEKEKDAYQDIIALRKKALAAAKEESKYEDNVAEKIKEIAKLQSRINALSLDDSRDAKAEKTQLEEEMYDLQKELSDLQADHAQEAQEDALDAMQDDYEDFIDDRKNELEKELDSEEKLYQAAIARIGEDWEGLYDDLKTWNYEYGSTLQSELEDAWDAASAAVQRYGSYLAAVQGTSSYQSIGPSEVPETESGRTGQTVYQDTSEILSKMRQNSLDYYTVSDSDRNNLYTDQNNLAQQYRDATGDQIYSKDGTWYHANGSKLYSLSKDEIAHAIVNQMKANSAAYAGLSASQQLTAASENNTLGARLGQYLGANVYRDGDGVWWINGKKLYDVYHTGGIVGDNPTLKQNEVMAVLEKGEAVLDEQREEGLYKIVDFVQVLSEKLGKAIDTTALNSAFANLRPTGIYDQMQAATDGLSHITNNRTDSIHFGDVYIYGGNDDTVQKHQEINRQFTNEILKQLNLKR